MFLLTYLVSPTLFNLWLSNVAPYPIMEEGCLIGLRHSKHMSAEDDQKMRMFRFIYQTVPQCS